MQTTPPPPNKQGHNQKLCTASGIYRGHIIKMVARSSNRASKGFYKALNDVSTADFLKNQPVAKQGPFYEIERVLSHRRIRGKVRKYFFILYRFN